MNTTKNILKSVMMSLKAGINGSEIADNLVNEFGMERENALTIITGTIILLQGAGINPNA